MEKKMSKIIDLIKKYKEIILYIIVGVLTTAVSFSVQWLFTDVILVNVVTKATIASIIAWITSVLFAFFANKLIVFERKQREGFFKELGLFYASRAFTGVLEIASTFVFVTILGSNWWVVKIIATIVVLILNYVLSKFIVFRKKKQEEKEQK
jgi:putative flippase GtrA